MIACQLQSGIGVGFKPQHFDDLLKESGPLDFIEIHAENYMGAGGLPHAMLEHLRADYALSIHGVGLSIGGAGPLDRTHLARLKTLCDRYQPDSFSEHLAWSTHDGEFFNDLLPLPYTTQTLRHVSDHIDELQSCLGRQILLENPSTYLCFEESTLSETDFLSEVAARTGCGLLLDVNSVFVSSVNHGLDPRLYLEHFPTRPIQEIHLGGHARDHDETGTPILIDAHGTPVADPVWTLYAETIGRLGPIPTLIEWDNDVPPWSVLLQEITRAHCLLNPVPPQHTVPRHASLL